MRPVHQRRAGGVRFELARPPSSRRKSSPRSSNLCHRKKKARLELALAMYACKVWHGKAELWKEHKGRYPASLEAMKAPLMGEPPLEVEDDPRGNAYVYEAKDGRVRVSSFGPDGKQGTADDISSPED